MKFGIVLTLLAAGLLTSSARMAAEHPAAAATDLSREPARQDDLPDGEGKKILQAACTGCHDLTEVTKFKGYLTRDEWRDIVRTMVEYGAAVTPADVDVLVDYLVRNLGKRE